MEAYEGEVADHARIVQQEWQVLHGRSTAGRVRPVEFDAERRQALGEAMRNVRKASRWNPIAVAAIWFIGYRRRPHLDGSVLLKEIDDARDIVDVVVVMAGPKLQVECRRR